MPSRDRISLRVNALASMLLTLGVLVPSAPAPASATPAIGVKPEALTVALPPGGTAERSLLITNAGTGDLNWTAFTSDAEAFYPRTRGSVFTYRDLPPDPADRPAAGDNGGAADDPGFGTRICTADRATGDEPRILVYASLDPSHDAFVLALQRIGLGCTMVTGWTSLGAALTNDGPWDLVIVNSYSMYPTTASLDALTLHVDTGGSLIYADWSLFSYPAHDLLARLGVSYQSSFTQPYDFAAATPLHRCFRRPNEIAALHWNLNQHNYDGQFVSVLDGASGLATFQGHPEAAALVLGASGRTVFNAFQASNFQADDDGDGLRDVVELAENEISLVGCGRRWLTIAPNGGTLTAGATQAVTVTFTAAPDCGVPGSTLIVVESDDPLVPSAAVTATITPLSLPHLVVAPEGLDFGTLLLGAAVNDTLYLTNTGCTTLSVDAVSSDHAAFVVAPTPPFTLARDASRAVPVTYAPVQIGTAAGTLTILSDDPVTPASTIPLTGTAATPPVIVVSPDSLRASLDPGGSSTALLSVRNAGGFALEWSASVSAARALALRTRGASFTISDLPRRAVAPDAGVANGTPPGEPWIGRRLYAGDRSAGYEPRVLLLASYQPASNAYSLALQRLGFGHTLVPDWFELESALESEGPWDLVIVDNYFASPTATGLDALVDHLDLGGSLIFADWAVYSYDHHTLLARLGIDYASTFTTPLYVSAINPQHRCFRDPNAVSNLFWNVDLTTRDGQIVAVRDGALRLAEFEGHPGSGAIVLDATGRAIFNGFQSANYTSSDDDDGLRDVVELAENEILLVGFGPSWLTLEPAAGVVPGGGTQVLTATFDATRLCDGDLAACLELASSDPATPAIAVPAALHVSGGGDLTVTPASLDFGSCFAGTTASLMLDLVNDGCRDLTVTDMTSDHEEFATTPATPLTIPPNTRQTLQVDYRPVTHGPIAGNLVIASDDPDEPTVAVPLTGTGLPAPVISLTPGSLAAELHPGAGTTRSLTIANTGDHDLDWTASVLDASTTRPFDLPALGFEPESRLAADLQDLSGVRVMWAAHHGQAQPAGWSSMIGDLELRGAAVVVNTSPVTSDLLDGFDLVWTVNCAAGWSAGELDLLAAWVQRGGGLLLSGDSDASVPVFNAILSASGADITYSADDAVSGPTTRITPHATTSGVTRLSFASPGARLAAVVHPSRILLRDTVGNPTGAWCETGRGRLIALSEEMFGNGELGTYDNRLFGNQVFDWLAVDNWLRIDPAGGSVPPGAAQDLTVVFDAYGRCGDALSARIAVVSNDPQTPEVSAPAALDIFGEADLAVAPATVAFGAVHPGDATTATLTLTNEGCSPLSIASLSTGNPIFTVDPAGPALLAPQEALVVSIAFSPSVAGSHAAALSIASDDPDEPVMSVPLIGACTEPSSITTTPTSFAVALPAFVGETALPLTIKNHGQGDLVWSAQVRHAAATRTYTLPPHPGAAACGALTAELRDLTGLRILWDRRHTQSDHANWSSMIGDLVLRGATVTVNWQPITAEILAGSDVLWSSACSSGFTTAELATLSAWLRQGGSLILEGDTDTSVVYFNAILSAVGAGIAYGYPNPLGGTTSGIEPHATTAGIGALFLNSPGATLAATAVPARIIVSDVRGAGVAACSHVGRGRVIAFSDELFAVWGLNSDDNRLFGNQVFDWLAGSGWLQIEPEAGTVPPGEKMEAKVWFNALDICGGVFTADIVLSSNDPLTPESVLPASLDVLGEPEISMSPSAFDFGARYVGSRTDAVLTIANISCAPLTVTAVTSDHVDFIATPAGPFTVPPGATRDVIATYAPSSAGPVTGTLTVESDDDDESAIAVPLTGTGLNAPVIAVTPESLVSQLYVGESETRTLSIANSGTGDLIWTLSTSVVDRPAGGDRVAPRILLLPSLDMATDVFITALNRLGLDFTQTTSWQEFTTWLLQGGPWDLVIVNNATLYNDSSAYNALKTHLDLGRFLIFSDMANYSQSDAELMSRLGVAYRAYSTTPLDFAAADPDHRCFRMPNSVHSFHWDLDSNNIDVIIVETGTGARALASFQGLATSPAVVLNPSGRAIYNAFPPRIYTGDDDGDGRRDLVELAENEIMMLVDATRWLSVWPTMGVIAPGESQIVTVGFDATFLAETTDYCAGVFAARIVVGNNDPRMPTHDIPVTLQTLGEPYIQVAQTGVGFAPQQIGATTTRSLPVANRGCEPLTIDAVSSDHPEFTVSPAGPLMLAPEETRVLSVIYTPASLGEVAGALSITSDDRRQPTITIPLSGTGLAPPVIAVSPDSLAVTLPVGGFASRILTIADQGAGELNWSAITCLPIPPDTIPGSPAFSFRDPPNASSGPKTGEWNCDQVISTSFGNREYLPVLATPDAPRILLQSSFEAENDAFTIALRRMGLGHTLTTTWEDFVAAATNDGPWDLMIANNYSQPTSATALNTMLAHLDAGGSLIFADWGLYYYVSHALVPRLGISYQSTFTTPQDVAAFEERHVCFHWPNEIHDLRWDANQHIRDGQLATALPGARRLASFPEYPNSAAIILDATGRAIYNAFQTANYTADDDGDGLRDAVELAQNEIFLVGLRADWLTVAPTTGLVPPGGTQDVTVSFEASNVAAGTHRAMIVLQSDDPLRPLVFVPTDLTVNGSALTAASATPTTGTWALTIGIEGAASSIVIGQHADATDARDPAKDLPAPAGAAGEPRLALLRPDWADAGVQLFTADIRAADAVRPVYAARLESAAARKIHLRWNRDDLPADLDLELRCAGRTLLPSLRGEDGVTLTLDGSPLDVEFAVIGATGAPDAVGPALYNRPNPFNPSTWISFRLDRSGSPAVLIHDACGVLVRRLEGGLLPAGPASLEWDGRDRRGREAASGIYLYRLIVDGRQQGEARKMVLVR